MKRGNDAASLNVAARAVMRAEGIVAGAEIDVFARDRESKASTQTLARGDRICFGEAGSRQRKVYGRHHRPRLRHFNRIRGHRHHRTVRRNGRDHRVMGCGRHRADRRAHLLRSLIP